MNPQNTPDVKSIFGEALEIADADRRAAYLAEACADAPAIRAEVEELLHMHDRAGGFLNRPAGLAADITGTFEPSSPPVSDLLVGTVIAGRYKLLEEIGEGGMGTVWVAAQSEPVKRKVAIKLIKAGMDSRQVLARFEAERQALALMDHPNIAKVLDGGLHEQRPYFVMELVKGVPITDYCDQCKLAPKQRLELFVSVCQAIQHAHQKGIIHRDIKPSNVLVALYDDRPVVKVIDFGVAKATGGALTDATIDTGIGGVVGTPQYMSPEQATFNNLDIDTRSDVYALGVLLYELLTGSPPFSSKELQQKGLLEMLRVVREEEPPRPSTKLSTADALPTLSANRGTEPRKLTGLLRNELDWIVMKALEKDRARRYETANGFAADVLRYLAGDAVQACPPSATYRLRKFAKRNRAALITAASLACLLVAGIAVSTWQAVRATRAERAAVAARDAESEQKRLAQTKEAEAVAARQAEEKQKRLAQTKEAEANAVVEFFQKQVFAAGRPKGQDGGLGSAVSLRDAIVSALPALDNAFKDQPLVEARLRMALGTTFYYLGEAKRAAEQYEGTRSLYTRHLGPNHPDTLSVMNNLTNSYEALGRHKEALKLNEETLAAMKRVLPKDHPGTLSSMHNLANSYSALGRHAEALKLYEETQAAQKRVLPKDHPDTLLSMHNLANCYYALGRHEEALKLFEETLAARKRVLPKDHPDTLQSMNNLANSYHALGRRMEALKLREETLAAQKRVLPKDHPDTLKSMTNLAVSYYALGRHAEAIKLFEETLAAQKRVLPRDHPDTLLNMSDLASIYASLGRHAEAIKLYEETLAAKKRVLPKDHPATLACMHNLAISYAVLGRHAEALKAHEETLAARKRVLPKDHPDTLISMACVAETLTELNRGEEAIPIIDECVSKAAGKAGVNPSLIPIVVGYRLRYFQKQSDPAGCRATAAMWEKLNRTDAVSLYIAARFRAVTAAVQAKAGGADAAEMTKEDADQAMAWLTKAVAAGWKDISHMRKDTDLDALRNRDDYKKLLESLPEPKK